MISFLQNLLRRTPRIVVLVAAASLFSHPAAAQTVTLSGASGPTCTYTSIAVTPNGNFSVTCAATQTTPGAAGTFSLNAPGQLNTGTSGAVSVSRSGGATGAYSVTVSLSANPAGTCTLSGSALSFPDGSASSTPGSLTLTAVSAGTCTLTIGAPTGSGGTSPTVGTSSATVSIVTASTPPPPSAGCPAGYVEPGDLIFTDLGISGHGNTIALKSGQVGATALPTIQGNVNSGQIIMTESSTGPVGAVTVELSISKCRGYIPTGSATAAGNPGGGACYYKSNVATTSSLLWAIRPIPGVDSGSLEGYGVCAAMDNAPYFFNVRYNYAQCFYGTCSYIVEWYNGWF